LLVALTLVVATVFSLLPRIPQPQSYHHLADQRSYLGIHNFGDVVSNLPFALIGLWGLVFLTGSNGDLPREHFIDKRERWPYRGVFVGLLLTSLGSSYYHLAPDNARLVWDRLPMTVVFMSIVGAAIAERVSMKVGLWLMPILLLVGIGSVLQWYASEVGNAGDLRFYAAVQVYSGLVLLLVLSFPARYDRDKDFALVIVFYVLAKILELLDKPIFAMARLVSGHTLKHLTAAAAGYCILRMLQRRRPVLA
jgi:hypothetical protein